MTLVQMQSRSANATVVPRTVNDVMEAAGPQVCDDMTVEVAMAVMASARADHLLVCDEDGLCTGLVTQSQLAAIRDSAAYTDQLRLRAVLGERGPFASPATTMAEADHAMRYRRLAALPVVDERGSPLGVLALAR
ncbi:CBS domain-containing protein [Streptomyces antarcticus]|uniref:CBS domain-containing protein n=1 Tax=Streptomyces antarcticus TaxID=2996458 RepID=UPI002270E408|nr:MULTISPECIES: CBS domain-containing protein [unclassified Streptomyces]MCY0944834.1 CBS domain-containing protein [Streptomyces sp. H34-AA3]MCY0953199.1 CBS domain-containing protein [Streptomyces sp. H27-S2]MCZ4081133.1 CBS domain-containing protein [Streptomyces sp. H34-S5]